MTERVRFPIHGVTYHSADETAAYIAAGAWVWSTFGDALRDAAREQPDKTYIVADDGTLTFGQLDALSESVAASLLELGLAPGDRAIFQVGTVKELVVALFGCFKAGVLPVCTLPQYREIEIGQLATLSGARAYFVQADFSPGFDLVGFARKMMAQCPTLEKLVVVRGPAQAGEVDLDALASRFTTAEARERTKGADPLPGDAGDAATVRRFDRRAEDHPAHACRISRLLRIVECAA